MFEDYLQTEHSMGYTGTDDNMPDSYESWLTDLSVDELIEYADDYAKTRMKEQEDELVKSITGKVIIESMLDEDDSEVRPEDEHGYKIAMQRVLNIINPKHE